MKIVCIKAIAIEQNVAMLKNSTKNTTRNNEEAESIDTLNYSPRLCDVAHDY